MREPEGWNSDGVDDSGLNLNFDHHWHDSDMPACVVSWHESSIIVHEGERSLLGKNSL